MIKQGFRPGDTAFGNLPDRIKIACFIVAAAVKAAAAVQAFAGDGDHAAANLKHRPAADLPVETVPRGFQTGAGNILSCQSCGKFFGGSQRFLVI